MGEDGVAVGVEVDLYAKVPAVRDFAERAQGLLAEQLWGFIGGWRR